MEYDYSNEQEVQDEEKRWKKGYVSPDTCSDGEDTHDWEDQNMREDGMDFPIRVCTTCGFWQ